MSERPTFYHEASGSYVSASNHREALRYRRNHRFVEVDPDTYQPLDLSDIAENAPDAPESGSDAPDSTETATPILVDADQIAGMTVAEVLDWAGDDTDRLLFARACESVGRNRSTLLAALNRKLK